MKKFLSLIISLSLWTSAFGQGDPAPFIKGQSTTGLGNAASTIFVPYRQSTKINAYQALLETGNENLLANPGMEGAATAGVANGWTLTAGTASLTSVAGEFSGGTKAQKIVLSTQTLNFSQSINTSAGILKQGVVGIRYKTSVGITFRSIIDGTTQTIIDTTNGIVADNTWRLVEIPVVFGATSASISARTPGATSGTFFFDDAYVRVGLSSLGSLNNITNPVAYTPSITGGTYSDEGTYWHREGKFLIARGTFAISAISGATLSIGLPIVGGVQLTIDPNVQSSTTNVNSVGIMYNTAGTATNRFPTIAAGPWVMNTDTAVSSSAVYVSSAVNGSRFDKAAASLLFANTDRGRFEFKVPISQWSSDGVAAYMAANANSAWVTCAFSTMVWQGFGTVTNNSLECKRDGTDLLMRGRITVGTATANIGQFLLPNNWGNIVTKTTLGANTISGIIWRKAVSNSTIYTAIMQPNVNYFNYSGNVVAGAVDPTIPINGNAEFVTGTIAEFNNVRIPIEGWSSASMIVGSFAGYTNVPGYQGLVDTFSFTFGATANTSCTTSPCPYLDQIGNIVSAVVKSGTGNYNANFNRTYSRIFCTAGCVNAGPCAAQPIKGTNANTVNIITQNASANALADSLVTMQCQGTY